MSSRASVPFGYGEAYANAWKGWRMDPDQVSPSCLVFQLSVKPSRGNLRRLHRVPLSSHSTRGNKLEFEFASRSRSTLEAGAAWVNPIQSSVRIINRGNLHTSAWCYRASIFQHLLVNTAKLQLPSDRDPSIPSLCAHFALNLPIAPCLSMNIHPSFHASKLNIASG